MNFSIVDFLPDALACYACGFFGALVFVAPLLAVRVIRGISSAAGDFSDS